MRYFLLYVFIISNIFSADYYEGDSLVREGVYIPQEKTSRSNKVQEPTKKELLKVLETQVTFEVTGLLGATKDSIIDLIEYTG